jgi:hypothetical protein
VKSAQVSTRGKRLRCAGSLDQSLSPLAGPLSPDSSPGGHRGAADAGGAADTGRTAREGEGLVDMMATTSGSGEAASAAALGASTTGPSLREMYPVLILVLLTGTGTGTYTGTSTVRPPKDRQR